MSKSEILWDSYISDIKAHQHYKQRCLNFLPQLINGVIQHFELAHDAVYMGISEKELQPYRDAIDSLEELILPQKKGFWQIWLAFTFTKPSLFPLENFSLQLAFPLVFGIDAQYIQVSVKTNNLGEEVLLFSEGNFGNLEELSDFIFRSMHETIRDRISWDLQEQDKPQPIVL